MKRLLFFAKTTVSFPSGWHKRMQAAPRITPIARPLQEAVPLQSGSRPHARCSPLSHLPQLGLAADIELSVHGTQHRVHRMNADAKRHGNFLCAQTIPGKNAHFLFSWGQQRIVPLFPLANFGHTLFAAKTKRLQFRNGSCLCRLLRQCGKKGSFRLYFRCGHSPSSRKKSLQTAMAKHHATRCVLNA